MSCLVSVIIPTYNRASLLLKAVQSILSQTYRNVEVLVCDDGSTDNTREIVSSIQDERVRYIDCGPSHGFPAYARTQGVAAARGEWLAFCDDDDIWFPAKLESQFYFMQQHKVLACCTNAWKTDFSARYELYFASKKNCIYSFRHFYARNPVICSSMLVSARVFRETVQEFPPLKDVEDYACWFCIAYTHKIAYLSNPLLYYYDGNPSSIRPKEASFESQRAQVVAFFFTWLKENSYARSLARLRLLAAGVCAVFDDVLCRIRYHIKRLSGRKIPSDKKTQMRDKSKWGKFVSEVGIVIRTCVRLERRFTRELQMSAVWTRDAVLSVFDRRPHVKFSNWCDKMTDQSLQSFFMNPHLPESFRNFRLSTYRPQIEFFSVEGPVSAVRKSKAALKVFYTGEDVVKNFTDYSHECVGLCDLSIGFSLDRTEENYVRFPIWFYHRFNTLDKDEILRQIRAINALRIKKDKFCALIAHHDGAVGNNATAGGLRGRIFNLLFPIAPIDCPSAFRHNDDSLRLRFADNKNAYLRQYMFNICPENVSVRGYVTEKLFDAFDAGCIPIYNGADNKPEEGLVNPDALILYSEGRAEAVFDEVQLLWTNENYYHEFINRPRLLEEGTDYIYAMNKRLQAKYNELFESKLAFLRK